MRLLIVRQQTHERRPSIPWPNVSMPVSAPPRALSSRNRIREQLPYAFHGISFTYSRLRLHRDRPSRGNLSLRGVALITGFVGLILVWQSVYLIQVNLLAISGGGREGEEECSAEGFSLIFPPLWRLFRIYPRPRS